MTTEPRNKCRTAKDLIEEMRQREQEWEEFKQAQIDMSRPNVVIVTVILGAITCLIGLLVWVVVG